MPDLRAASKWARLDFPPQFRIGLEGLAELAEWEVRRRGDFIEVATRERYQGSPSRITDIIRVADSANATERARYESFLAWTGQDEFGSEQVRELVQNLREVSAPSSATDAWVSFRLQFSTIPDAQVGAFLADTFPIITAQMPSASLWKLDLSPALNWRAAAARTLFSAQVNPEAIANAANRDRLLPGPISQMPSLAFGFNAYVEPVLLTASPWVLGMNGTRRGGNAIVLFGGLQPGFSQDQAADLLHLLLPRAPLRAPITRFEVGPSAAERWLVWWHDRVRNALSMALDVGRFTGEDGGYRPAAQLGALLSLERLFASVQSTLANSTRADTRLGTFFDVIDLLDGLSFGSWESLLTPKRVRRDLSALEAELPPGSSELVLTRCRLAVDALETFSDDFDPSRLDPDGMLRVTERDGRTVRPLSTNSAVPQYLRILRNSTHSFRRMAQDPRDVSLLGSHSGEVPDALADLALLHLLRFLASPHLPSR